MTASVVPPGPADSPPLLYRTRSKPAMLLLMVGVALAIMAVVPFVLEAPLPLAAMWILLLVVGVVRGGRAWRAGHVLELTLTAAALVIRTPGGVLTLAPAEVRQVRVEQRLYGRLADHGNVVLRHGAPGAPGEELRLYYLERPFLFQEVLGRLLGRPVQA